MSRHQPPVPRPPLAATHLQSVSPQGAPSRSAARPAWCTTRVSRTGRVGLGGRGGGWESGRGGRVAGGRGLGGGHAPRDRLGPPRREGLGVGAVSYTLNGAGPRMPQGAYCLTVETEAGANSSPGGGHALRARDDPSGRFEPFPNPDGIMPSPCFGILPSVVKKGRKVLVCPATLSQGNP